MLLRWLVFQAFESRTSPTQKFCTKFQAEMTFRLDTRLFSHYNKQAIGVWRSLVSRLVRVQEAAGSNPATPTMASVFIAFERL